MPTYSNFTPQQRKKDISRFNADFKKLGKTPAGKEMLSEVADFSLKANMTERLDLLPSEALFHPARQTMELILMLPESLLSSPDSPVFNQELLLQSATGAGNDSSMLTLLLGTQAMILSKNEDKASVDYVMQVAFGRNKPELAIKEQMLKPFGPSVDIPEDLKKIMARMEEYVLAGRTRELLEQARMCGMQTASLPKPRLWNGRILNVSMKRPCSGGEMVILMENFQPDPSLRLTLPLTGETGDAVLVLYVDDAINNGNIVTLPDNTTSWTVTLPPDITSGEVSFEIAGAGNLSPECVEIGFIMQGSTPQLKPISFNIIAGRPVIRSFRVAQEGPVHPRQYVDLIWEVENADFIQIEKLSFPGSPTPDELPPVQVPSNQNKGSVRVSIPCSRRWKGQYFLRAGNNVCGEVISKEPVLLESGWSEYLIGTGVEDITDYTRGLGMMGFSDEFQKAVGVEMNLYSRAFVIAKNKLNQTKEDSIVIVVADLMSCTMAVKSKVVERLNQQNLGLLYSLENVMISGTHTHSAPGGYSDYFLYNYTTGGFDQHLFELIVDGIVRSIVKAHRNLAPGRIFVKKGDVENCGANRSMDAHMQNLDITHITFDGSGSTDKQMVLLKFVKDNDGNGNPINVGVLNWFGMHATSLGQANTLISGDNKGWAAQRFEQKMRPSVPVHEPFIAGFATGCTGDVSGSVGIPHNFHADRALMRQLGDIQFEKAFDLFDTATEELTGAIDFRYQHLDMSHIAIDGSPGARTWPAAYGISFGAGSTEDSRATALLAGINIPSGLKEGVTTLDLAASYFATGQGVYLVASFYAVPGAIAILSSAQIAAVTGIGISTASTAVVGILSILNSRGLLNLFVALLPNAVKSYIAFEGLRSKLRENPRPDNADGTPAQLWDLPELDPLNFGTVNTNGALFIEGHSPKPIMFPVGNCQPYPLVPNTVPIQLMKIGTLVIAGVPGEFTVMSGRRLKNTLRMEFGNAVNHVAVANYANGYSSYITTKEEYEMQHYEGASTLYGPHTLAAYQQEFTKLARAIVAGNTVEPGSPPELKKALIKHRGIDSGQLYVNNRSERDASIRVFTIEDKIQGIPANWLLLQSTAFANENLLINVPEGVPFNVSINHNPSKTYQGGSFIIIE